MALSVALGLVVPVLLKPPEGASESLPLVLEVRYRALGVRENGCAGVGINQVVSRPGGGGVCQN